MLIHIIMQFVVQQFMLPFLNTVKTCSAQHNIKITHYLSFLWSTLWFSLLKPPTIYIQTIIRPFHSYMTRNPPKTAL